MRFNPRALERIFEAAVLSASALQCDEDATLPDAAAPDATADAPRDATPVSDAGVVFADSSFELCEAGPPTFVEACGSCCQVTAVHCPIPPGDHVGDSGALYFCDRYCVGDAWAGCYVVDASADDATTYVQCGCTGRRFAGYRSKRVDASVGGWFANMARLEGAAVFAFRRLHDELEALNAPAGLLARVRRAVGDEERHARTMGRIAKRFGSRVGEPRAPRFRKRTVERMAIENATEGCVRELYGALLATWQAERAAPLARRAFRAIARDETRHAAISLSVAAFVESNLEPPARARVERERRRAIRALREEVARVAPRHVARVAGLPNATQALALFDALFS